MTDPEYCEIDVTARATLEKRTVVIGAGMHPCVEGEIEPSDNPLDTVTYWDMDKRGWRTFLIRKLDPFNTQHSTLNIKK